MTSSLDHVAAAIARRALPPPERRRQLREALGISQASMAQLVAEAMTDAAIERQVSRSAVCRWEAGDRTPRGAAAVAYATVLAAIGGL